MSDFEFDLFVLGAGSGGVRAARVAAGHGARVAIAEGYRVGGTCVIRGCVPKKLLVYGAHFAEDLRDAKRFGWQVPDCAFDWTTLRDTILADVDRLSKLYQESLDSHDIVTLHHRAHIGGPHEVALANGARHRARIILVATGARPAIPDCPGSEHGITSNEVFHLEDVPERILISGGGYIANEFAGIFHGLGSQVTVINRGGDILRHYDESIRARLLDISRRKGIEFRFHTAFEKIERKGNGMLSAHLTGQDPVETDCLLLATGRRPNSDDLGLEQVGIALDPNGAIQVDRDSRTSVPSIFAIGDVTDRVQLTPVAIREGHAFSDTQFGGKPWRIDYDTIPSAVFSHPPLAAVGLTEAQARARFDTVQVYCSDFRPMKNVLAGRDERALYKMVVEGRTQKVLGLHMIGPEAPEILQAAAIAVKAGLTKTEFDETVALHPTMSEELVLLK